MNKQQKIKHWQGIFEQQKSSGLITTLTHRLSMFGVNAFLTKR